MPPGIPGGMTISLAAILFLVALIVFVIAAFLPPIHPRLGYIAWACVAGGLFCMVTHLGG